MKRDDHGDRMKYYEGLETSKSLMKGIPVYGRLDGKSFSKFTKPFKYPYDKRLRNAFDNVCKYLVESFNFDLIFHQSDEISFCWDSCSETPHELMFGGKIQKLASIIAAKASVRFLIEITKECPELVEHIHKNVPVFDCRIFNVPDTTEMINQFVWREKDCTKNSVSMLASVYYSHKQLTGKNTKEKLDMIVDAGDNWNNWDAAFKRGTYLRKTQYEKEPDVIRTKVVVVEVPPITKVQNKIGVLLNGASPIMYSGDV